MLSSFAIILLGNREPVALLLLSSSCNVAVIVLCLFLTVSWVGLQRVIVPFSGHVHLLSVVKLYQTVCKIQFGILYCVYILGQTHILLVVKREACRQG